MRFSQSRSQISFLSLLSVGHRYEATPRPFNFIFVLFSIFSGFRFDLKMTGVKRFSSATSLQYSSKTMNFFHFLSENFMLSLENTARNRPSFVWSQNQERPVVLNDQCPFLNEITFKADSESLSQ
jgi:hypothetical protein